MALTRWTLLAINHRRATILLSLLTTFAGVALIIDRPKGTVLEWLAVPLLAIGGALFTYVVRPRKAAVADHQNSLAGRLVRLVTLRGRLVPVFPALGIGMLLADFAYNLLVSATPALQTEDTIVLLAAATLCAYGFVPARFAKERDFGLIFVLALNGILVLPLLAARVYYADFERSVDVYSWVALAPQTSEILSLLGVANTLHPVVGSTAPGLTFSPRNFVGPVTIVITTACSGIYSFGIFASAFVAFVLTEYEKPSPRVWAMLGFGLLTSYAANVFRMVVIVLVGYYTDTAQTDLQNMIVAHSYAGWAIFLTWIAAFWTILLKFFGPESIPATRVEYAITRNSCRICDRDLTPAILATRCECGASYHQTCLRSAGSCPRCGAAPPLVHQVN